MTDYSALLEEACRFFERHLTDEHRRHLWTRYGLLPDFVEAMRIGYAPADGSALLLHLMDRGYSRDEIIGSGLVVPATSSQRRLNDYERSRLALKMKDVISEKAKKNQIRKPESVPQNSVEQKIDTQKELAKIADVSHDTFDKDLPPRRNRDFSPAYQLIRPPPSPLTDRRNPL